MRGWAVLLVASVLVAACGDDGSGPAAPSANNSPAMAQLPDTVVSIGDTLRLRAVAVDADGDEVRYQLTVFLSLEEIRAGYRAQVGMNGTTGEFWFAPKFGDRPRREFEIAATDDFGGRDSTGFVVAVP